MTAFSASWRSLCALALSASACEVYTPDLVQSSPQGGTGGMTGTGASAATGASTPVGATGGEMSAGATGATGGTSSGSGGTGGEPEPETVPYLTVAIQAPSIDVQLTPEGALDWAHWGLGSASDRNQKAGVTSLLLDFTPTGAKLPARLLDGPTLFGWTDGTPTATGSTNDGISWQGMDEGFEIVIPAVEGVRKLRLYVGVFNGTAALKAALSDPRANSIGDDKVTSPGAAWNMNVITILYGNATLADTTMTVSWSLEEANAANGAVALTAITIGNG